MIFVKVLESELTGAGRHDACWRQIKRAMIDIGPCDQMGVHQIL